jgi:chemotaxis protein histidine kinase CheA
MGRAFHRKRISVNRGKTRGSGFKYLDVVPPDIRELTAEQVAATELEAQKQAAQDQQRRLQQREIDNIVSLAGNILAAWKQAMEFNDRRLAEFAGWTTSSFCLLSVDEDVADYYADQIERHQREADRPLSLEELDEVVRAVCKRRVPIEQVVEEAIKAVRYAAQECTQFDGIELERFIEMMLRRAARAKHTNTSLGEALAFVGQRMVLMLQALREVPNAA